MLDGGGVRRRRAKGISASTPPWQHALASLEILLCQRHIYATSCRELLKPCSRSSVTRRSSCTPADMSVEVA